MQRLKSKSFYIVANQENIDPLNLHFAGEQDEEIPPIPPNPQIPLAANDIQFPEYEQYEHENKWNKPKNSELQLNIGQHGKPVKNAPDMEFALVAEMMSLNLHQDTEQYLPRIPMIMDQGNRDPRSFDLKGKWKLYRKPKGLKKSIKAEIARDSASSSFAEEYMKFLNEFLVMEISSTKATEGNYEASDGNVQADPDFAEN
uniref:Uncharacterized protein n=1 Tax=Caenorhabditis japonica TaxID=281687 RepID=A0A8R1J0W4_CAEJA